MALHTTEIDRQCDCRSFWLAVDLVEVRPAQRCPAPGSARGDNAPEQPGPSHDGVVLIARELPLASWLLSPGRCFNCTSSRPTRSRDTLSCCIACPSCP